MHEVTTTKRDGQFNFDFKFEFSTSKKSLAKQQSFNVAKKDVQCDNCLNVGMMLHTVSVSWKAFTQKVSENNGEKKKERKKVQTLQTFSAPHS